MINNWVLLGYRELNKQEQGKVELAIDWLRKKHIRPKTIALITLDQLDREGKIISFEKGSKFVTFSRNISYAGTPFDLYLTEVFPVIKSKKFVFTRWAWTGRRDQLGSHIPVAKVEEIIENRDKRLLTKTPVFATMRIAKVSLHINY